MTSLKIFDCPASKSSKVSAPVASRVASSETAPSDVPDTAGISFVPVTMTVIVAEVDAPLSSTTVTAKFSKWDSPSASCSTEESLLLRV